MMGNDEFEEDGHEAEPLDMLASYFEANGWAFQHNGEDEIAAKMQGSWAQYEIRAIWRPEDQVLQLLALPDIRVADDKRAAIYETIGLINEQLWMGHFELWSNSGVVLFRHGTLLGQGDMLSLDQAQLLVEAALDECERFYPVFQFVLWGGKTPAEAIVASMIETRGEA
ncbi:MAG: YbjN domain-containing protein [Sphingobium sp.]|nr:YbjN domain-containing protein [Sphingobium sp.]MCP5400161.1 YbjN domain-containing protein [Sphingomonas sp.]